MSKPLKQIHLAAHFPGVNNTTVWSDPKAGSQEAIATYRPVFEGYLGFQKRLGVEPVFPTLEDFVERSSALIGSPQQVIEKVHRYHEQFGHSVRHLHADAGGLTDDRHRASLELFQSDIAPVLRRDIPDPPFAWAPASPSTDL
jgi:alkanesulfonate monooxygenase SsuD/methylene tetrahydromethanopterin reductase-like flavin-dependent oxidoreductase (luciferase family)